MARAERRTEPAKPRLAPGLEVVRRRSKGLIRRSPVRRLAPAAILGAIGVVAVIFAILLEQVILAQSAFELSRLRSDLATVQARHERAMFEASQLESPERIERYARDELGMIEPPLSEYVIADVKAPRSPGLAQSARRSSLSGSPAAAIGAAAETDQASSSGP
ncbi:MAG: cell division protein FtsL [Actinobacteria bacterium]|nr:cell division protein FtsL [Actinomycetota bacterium]